MTSNYQNYIYLFDENMWISRRILFRTGDKIWDVNGNAEKLNTQFLKDAGLEKAQIIAGQESNGNFTTYYDASKLKNFPNKENAVNRKFGVYLGEVLSPHTTPENNIFVLSGDPGQSTNMVSIFDLTATNGTNAGSVEFKSKKGNPYYDFYKFGYFFSLLGTGKLGYRNLAGSFIDEKYGTGPWEAIYPPGLIPSVLLGDTHIKLRPYNKDDQPLPANKKMELSNPNVPFHYKQNITYVHEQTSTDPAYKQKTDNQWKTKINDFVKGYDLFLKMARMQGLATEIDYGATTIGVPYDFQTVMFEEINKKQTGVSTKQPKYDKIYNYYDSQYEPAVMKMIEGEVMTENSLPSIYDFLYLEHQSEIKPFIKIPSLPLDATSLSAINQYLDNFAALYEKYAREGLENQTVKQYMDTHVGSYIEPIKPFSSAELGWASTNINDKISENVFLKKFRLNEQKKMLLSLDAISNNEELLDSDKNNRIPAWIDDLKTGLYFSEKSLNIFEQTYDKDSIFPYLIKLNIPLENIGPIVKIFKENDLLDSLNTYIASLTIPGELKTIPYGEYFGGAINGADASNFNVYNRLALSSTRIFFSAPPTMNEINEAGSAFAPLIQSADDIDDDQNVPELNSWRERNIQKFIDSKFGSAVNAAIDGVKIFLKVYPKKDETNIAKYGSRWFIWALTKDGIIIDDNFGHELTGLVAEKEIIDSENGQPFQLSDTARQMITDLTEAPYDYFSFSSAVVDKETFKVSEADIYIDNLGAHGSIPPQVFVYKNDKESILGGTSPIQGLIAKLKELKMKKKLNKLFLNSGILRTPDDIHEGKMCHEETLMYEIAKYKINDLGEEKYLQSIFLPIVDKNQLSYYDTQIIPFTDYFYKIFAHKVILGTKYSVKMDSLHHDVNIRGIANGSKRAAVWFDMPYDIEPYLEIVRVPYYNTEPVNITVDELNYSRVEDAPPLAPQVDIVPYKNVDNKILILMNNSIGSIEQYPKIIFKEDEKRFQDASLAQDKAPGTKLTFKSDDSQGIFELIQLQNLPKTYSDISKDRTIAIYEAKSLGDKKNDSFVLNIRPNKDYYFIARFIDIHDKVSNPTDVYKIRMIHEEGTAPYLTMKVMDIGQESKNEHDEKFTATRNMQKYVLVQPNFLNSSLYMHETKFNEEGHGKGSALDSISGVYAGDSSSSERKLLRDGLVFGRKFKIRITSKQTGRKIDVNLTVKPPETIINE